jgi:hypothetical protein
VLSYFNATTWSEKNSKQLVAACVLFNPVNPEANSESFCHFLKADSQRLAEKMPNPYSDGAIHFFLHLGPV